MDDHDFLRLTNELLLLHDNRLRVKGAIEIVDAEEVVEVAQLGQAQVVVEGWD